MENLRLICFKCVPRLKRKDNITTSLPLEVDEFKKFKKNLKKDGHKLNKRVVLTTCLGDCPKGLICTKTLNGDFPINPCLSKKEFKEFLTKEE